MGRMGEGRSLEGRHHLSRLWDMGPSQQGLLPALVDLTQATGRSSPGGQSCRPSTDQTPAQPAPCARDGT